MPLFVTRTYSPDEYYADCECAILDLSPAFLDLLQERVNAALAARANCKDVAAVCFDWPLPYSYEGEGLIDDCDALGKEDEFRDQIMDGALLALPATIEPKKDARVDRKRMTVSLVAMTSDTVEAYIHWECCPRHTSVTVETQQYRLAELDALLSCADQE